MLSLSTNSTDIINLEAETRLLFQDYQHYCDDCSHAHNFTCSGIRSKICMIEKHRLRDKINSNLTRLRELKSQSEDRHEQSSKD